MSSKLKTNKPTSPIILLFRSGSLRIRILELHTEHLHGFTDFRASIGNCFEFVFSDDEKRRRRISHTCFACLRETPVVCSKSGNTSVSSSRSSNLPRKKLASFDCGNCFEVRFDDFNRTGSWSKDLQIVPTAIGEEHLRSESD